MTRQLTLLISISLLLLIPGCGGGINNPGIPGPTGLSYSDITSTSFILHWSAISDADSYTVYKNGGLYVSGITGTSYSITGLSPSTTYRMTVSYTKGTTESDQSASLNVPTLSTSENKSTPQ